MTIVVDTGVLIDHLRGEPRARQVFEAVLSTEPQRLTASVLSRVEVLAGMRPGEADATHSLFSAIEWIAVDETVADRAGGIANRFLRSHPGVDPVDFVVAATTEMLDAELWTTNTKHFPMFPGLQPPY